MLCSQLILTAAEIRTTEKSEIAFHLGKAIGSTMKSHLSHWSLERHMNKFLKYRHLLADM